MTKKQPILDELHAVREQLLAESGGTLAGLVARLQAEQAKSSRTILEARRASASACTGAEIRSSKVEGVIVAAR